MKIVSKKHLLYGIGSIVLALSSFIIVDLPKIIAMNQDGFEILRLIKDSIVSLVLLIIGIYHLNCAFSKEALADEQRENEDERNLLISQAVHASNGKFMTNFVIVTGLLGVICWYLTDEDVFLVIGAFSLFLFNIIFWSSLFLGYRYEKKY